MIIPLASTSLLLKVKVENGNTNVKFGEITEMKGRRLKGLMKYNVAGGFDNGPQYITLDIEKILHFRKLPLDLITFGGVKDRFSLTSEKVVDWANSFVEWDTPASALPPEGRYITFVVLYEDLKK